MLHALIDCGHHSFKNARKWWSTGSGLITLRLQMLVRCAQMPMVWMMDDPSSSTQRFCTASSNHHPTEITCNHQKFRAVRSPPNPARTCVSITLGLVPIAGLSHPGHHNADTMKTLDGMSSSCLHACELSSSSSRIMRCKSELVRNSEPMSLSLRMMVFVCSRESSCILLYRPGHGHGGFSCWLGSTTNKSKTRQIL